MFLLNMVCLFLFAPRAWRDLSKWLDGKLYPVPPAPPPSTTTEWAWAALEKEKKRRRRRAKLENVVRHGSFHEAANARVRLTEMDREPSPFERDKCC